VAILAAATLAACGGPEAQSGPDTQAPGSEPTDGGAPPVASAAATDGSGDDPLGFGEEENVAVVTVGDDRYEFSDLYCVSMGGAMGATSVGGDPQLNIDLPPLDWETSDEGWDAPSIRISGDDPYFDMQAGGDTMAADERVEPGSSQVDSFDSDGYRASGEATFIDATAVMVSEDPEPITGTFEVTCARP
jgi:hypothetical protein